MKWININEISVSLIDNNDDTAHKLLMYLSFVQHNAKLILTLEAQLNMS